MEQNSGDRTELSTLTSNSGGEGEMSHKAALPPADITGVHTTPTDSIEANAITPAKNTLPVSSKSAFRTVGRSLSLKKSPLQKLHKPFGMVHKCEENSMDAERVTAAESTSPKEHGRSCDRATKDTSDALSGVVTRSRSRSIGNDDTKVKQDQAQGQPKGRALPMVKRVDMALPGAVKVATGAKRSQAETPSTPQGNIKRLCSQDTSTASQTGYTNTES